jgi:hypothetical protein
METAIWVLVGMVGFVGFAISNQLKSIEGKLNGIRGLLSSDGPDPGFTSYQRMSAGSLSTLHKLIERKLEEV